ncbi:S8 family serine peptidase [Phenylobacterium terrae]|uniref:S8 family serine peptidase n=1 Tax=Phenylobacterium terrae TaxID=2665495 RepID=A0ABW4N4H2_9CAUL
MIRSPIAALAAALALAAQPASAQLIGGGGLPGLPGVGLPTTDLPRPSPPRARTPRTPPLAAPESLVRETVPPLAGAVGETLEAVPAQLRRLRLEELLRAHPQVLEQDEAGAPVVSGRVLALAPTEDALAAARQTGFEVVERADLAAIGVQLIVLRPPSGLSAREAVQRLRQLDPAGTYEFDHLYADAGQAAAPGGGTGRPAPRRRGAVRIGLVDTGVAARHPALASGRIVQRGFAPGGLTVQPHGTAVASLLAGRSGAFRGAAPGAELYVADVYGSGPTGGSAAILVRALAWLAEMRTPVINVSLVGPPNRVLEAAVQGLSARGHLLVAAVGNDGPAAPPLYPAAYPGVVAVTGVDGRGRALLEAGRGEHVDFAAPGADMAAAHPSGGFAPVRGTSFAAPLVAGELARRLGEPDPAAAARAVSGLSRLAADLGPKGRDRTFGAGLVAADRRTAPAAVAARGPAIRGD